MSAVAIGSTILNTDANKVSYWTFDSSNSNDSWGSNNGTDSNMSYGAGQFSNAATFNGTSSKIDLGTNSSLNLTGALSLTLWLKTNGHPVGGKILFIKGSSVSTNSTWSYTMFLLAGGTAQFSVTDGTTEFDVITTTDVTDNTWRNVIGTYTPSTNIKIYQNGNNENTNSTTIPASLNSIASLHATMGNDTLESRWYTGSLDDVAIFSRALTAVEANGIANGFTTSSNGSFLLNFM